MTIRPVDSVVTVASESVGSTSAPDGRITCTDERKSRLTENVMLVNVESTGTVKLREPLSVVLRIIIGCRSPVSEGSMSPKIFPVSFLPMKKSCPPVFCAPLM